MTKNIEMFSAANQPTDDMLDININNFILTEEEKKQTMNAINYLRKANKLKYTDFGRDIELREQGLFSKDGKTCIYKSVEEDTSLKLREKYNKLKQKRRQQVNLDANDTSREINISANQQTESRSMTMKEDEKTPLLEEENSELTNHENATIDNDKRLKDQNTVFPIFSMTYERK